MTDIYRKYKSQCYDIAYGILASCDDAEACTEAVLRSANEIATEDKYSLLSVLLLRSAREHALEAASASSKRRSELSLALDEMKDAVPSAVQLDTSIKDTAKKDLINSFLSSIPQRTRKIFIRRYWYFSPIYEISKDLHLTEEKARFILARTRKKLRWYLEKNSGQATDERKLIKALSLARDKYIDEADPTKEAFRRVRSLTVRGLSAACICSFIIFINLWLFLPLTPKVQDISKYSDSEYFSVIEKINSYRTEYPEYKNNYLKIVNTVYKILNGEMRSSNVYVTYPTYSPAYHETVESRSNGIISDGDLVKNEKYAFRLTRDFTIEIYTLKGEISSHVRSLSITPPEGCTFDYKSFGTIYLSKDGGTLTVLLDCRLEGGEMKRYNIFVFNIDVTDPKSMADSYSCDKDSFILRGYCDKSFVRDEMLYLVSKFYPSADFSDPDNFLPKYISFGKREFIVPNTDDSNDNVKNGSGVCAITSVCKLDLETLALEDVYSTFIYSKNIAIGEDSIFISYEYHKKDEGKDYKKLCTMTDIATVNYSDGGLYLKGLYSVEGTFGLYPYAINEKNGILRVVTETNDVGYAKKTSWLGVSRYTLNLLDKSISLYCIDTESGKVVASLERFIRQQQDEKPYLTPGLLAMRFEGDRVYIEGAHLSGKGSILYMIDMPDLTNLTYTASEPERYEFPCTMYDFGDDLILGVGNMSGKSGTIKVEIYQKTSDGKISVLCSSEGKYSYKGYHIQKSTLVDRESYLVGLVSPGKDFYSMRYVLLHFNGEAFEVVLSVDDISKGQESIYLDDMYDGVRSFIQDGYLYIICENNFIVKKLP